MKKPIIAMIIASMLFSTTSTITSFANDEKNSSTNVSAEENKDRLGLLAYYYKEEGFKDLILMGQTYKDSLMYNPSNIDELVKKEKQSFKSARWIGYIKSNETGKYTLKTSDDKNTIILLNGQVVSNNGENKKEITLTKDQPVFIEIIYNSNDKKLTNNFELFKVKDNKDEKVKRDELLTPDNNKNESKKFMTNKNKSLQEIEPTFDLNDLDGDGIPNDLEVSGYTVDNQQYKIVKWDESFADKGWVKYVSNPKSAYTTGDPYTDCEKALGLVPSVNAKETKNPLVAAYPSVSVAAEKFILSQNINMTNSATSDESFSETNTNTCGISLGLEWGGSVGILGPELSYKYSVNASYSRARSKAHTWGNSTTNTAQFNTAQAGYLNANIRYKNAGSGAIYNVKPTTSFILDTDTLHTITAPPQHQALSIKPGESYPQKGQAPIALNTINESNPINLSKPQLDKVLNSTPLKTETNQVDGNYARLNEKGLIEIGDSWIPIQDEIDEKTATIIFDTMDGEIIERKVAAKDYTDGNDATPSVTLEEALLASDKRFKKGPKGLYFEYEKDGKIVRKAVNGCSSMVVGDVNTINEIDRQIKDETGQFKDVKTLMDAKLTPKMNITINLAKIFDTGDIFETIQQPITIKKWFNKSGDEWDEWLPIQMGEDDGMYRLTPGFKTSTYMADPKLNLDPKKDYYVSFTLRNLGGISANPFVGTDYSGSRQEYIPANGVQRFSIKINIQRDQQLFLSVENNDQVYLDDIAIFEAN